MRHGARRYSDGCRCLVCRDGHRIKAKEYRVRYAARERRRWREKERGRRASRESYLKGYQRRWYVSRKYGPHLADAALALAEVKKLLRDRSHNQGRN